MSYDNTNRGALFKNEKKDQDNHPDYQGSIDVDGVDHWISAWIKTSESGRKYMSLSLKKKEAPAKKSAPPKSKKPAEEDSDIPF